MIADSKPTKRVRTLIPQMKIAIVPSVPAAMSRNMDGLNLSLKLDMKYTAGMNPNRYPADVPVNIAIPDVKSWNTGAPIAPINMYEITEDTADFLS